MGNPVCTAGVKLGVKRERQMVRVLVADFREQGEDGKAGNRIGCDRRGRQALAPEAPGIHGGVVPNTNSSVRQKRF